MIGKKLGGRYEVLEAIGGGGMALVYRAQDLLLNRSVAVKVLRPQFASDEDFVRRFKREAQAAASLSHPHIVSIYDVGDDGDTYYIVMELIEGRTLKDRIVRERVMPVADVLDIAYQICDALEHAHQNRIVHRDIKPHNILLTANGRVKVTDFGIARAMTGATLTYTGTVMGSVHYFSPEQARGGVIGTKSDLYSLGIVMYEMLTGTVPFQGESAVTVALKHMQEEILPPRTLNPDISIAVERLVMRALEKNPLERYESAAVMISDLNRCREQLRAKEHGRQGDEDEQKRQSILPSRREGRLPERRARAQVNDDTVVRAPNSVVVRAPNSVEDEGEEAVVRRRPIWAIYLIVFLVLITAAGVGTHMFIEWLHVPTVEVPFVIGSSYLEAQNMLRAEGLVAEQVAQQFHETIPANHIIDQHPSAQALVKEGRTVKLVVSQGQDSIVIPDLVGYSQRDGDVMLRQLGLALGDIEYDHHAEIPADEIMIQNPRANTRVGKGTTVDVVVSLGPEARMVTVPNFSGQMLDSVRQRLLGLHLEEGEIEGEHSDQPEDEVIGQYPEAGTEVEEGTAVDLIYSRGPYAGEKIETMEFVIPSNHGSVLMQVWVLDSRGTREVYRDTQRGGDRITLDIAWFGYQALIRVYLDGSLQYETVLPS